MSNAAVVILTARRAPQLLQALDSLAAGTLLPAEVLIVHNDPGDGSREAVAAWSGPFPVRSLEGRPGSYAEARNHGVAQTTQPYVAFLDDDCLARPDWLERLVAALDAGADAVGGAIVSHVDHDMGPGGSAELAWLCGLSPPGFWGEYSGRRELPATANMAFRRALWEEQPFQTLGGTFSRKEGENYALGREDAQWWRSLRRAGRRCRTVPEAVVRHQISAERWLPRVMEPRARADGRAHWLRERHREDLAPAAADLACVPWDVLADWRSGRLTLRQAWRLRRTWAIRQGGLLTAALETGDVTLPRLWLMVARESVAVKRGIAKKLLRKVAVRAVKATHHPRPLPSPADPPRRVLLVCYNFLGDAVLTLPLLEALREAFPQTELHVLCGPVAEPLYRARPEVHAVHVLPARFGGVWPKSLARTVRAAQPDVTLLTYFHHGSVLPLFAATEAPVVTWNQDTGLTRQTWIDLATVRVPKTLKDSEPRALLDLLKPLGVEGQLTRPRFDPPPAARDRVQRILRAAGLEPGLFAAIHLDTFSPHKRWPPRRWAAVAQYLHEGHGLKVAFVGTREQRGAFERLQLPRDWAIGLQGVFDAAELGAFFAEARICLGTDSGPMHLAQAVGAPTLVLFGPTPEERWGPMPQFPGEHAPPPFRTVRAPNALADWLPEECQGFRVDEAMRRLTAAQVCEAAEGLLASFECKVPSAKCREEARSE